VARNEMLRSAVAAVGRVRPRVGRATAVPGSTLGHHRAIAVVPGSGGLAAPASSRRGGRRSSRRLPISATPCRRSRGGRPIIAPVGSFLRRSHRRHQPQADGERPQHSISNRVVVRFHLYLRIAPKRVHLPLSTTRSQIVILGYRSGPKPTTRAKNPSL